MLFLFLLNEIAKIDAICFSGVKSCCSSTEKKNIKKEFYFAN